MKEFEKIYVNRADVNFVFFRKRSKNKKTIPDPYVVNGQDFFDISDEILQHDIIDELKVGTFARLFRTDNGRNQGAEWLKYEDYQHLFPEVDLEIDME